MPQDSFLSLCPRKFGVHQFLALALSNCSFPLLHAPISLPSVPNFLFILHSPPHIPFQYFTGLLHLSIILCLLFTMFVTSPLACQSKPASLITLSTLLTPTCPSYLLGLFLITLFPFSISLSPSHGKTWIDIYYKPTCFHHYPDYRFSHPASCKDLLSMSPSSLHLHP